MNNTAKKKTYKPAAPVVAILLLVALTVLIAAPAIMAQEVERDAKEAANLVLTDKTADKSVVARGDEVTYTIIVNNAGDVGLEDLSFSDELPGNLKYVSHNFDEKSASGSGGAKNNKVTWDGKLNKGGILTVTIVAMVRNGAASGAEIMNTAVISWPDPQNPNNTVTSEPSAEITVGGSVGEQAVLLPLVTYVEWPIAEILSFEATRVNSQNSWSLSWIAPGGFGYELQEAHQADFSDAVTYQNITNNTVTFNHPVTRDNTYYYRVRSAASAGIAGDWSETVKVIGGYRDDFDVPIEETTWWIRRTTNLDKVTTWHEFEDNYKWSILQVHDAYDMGMASPMREVPRLPYRIRLEMKDPDPSEGLGMGFVFAADKVTDECPSDTNTVEGWYEHKDCFNKFYEFRLDEAAAGERLDLRVRSIHNVHWNGPGDDPVTFEQYQKWEILDLSGVDWGDWNRIGVDVYEDHIDIYAGRRSAPDRYLFTIDENIYPENQYFGTLATTGERPKVTARYEYFEALPLGD